ncbi:MAG TPA: thioredoxin family protein [Fimbriimonadaceae bacterium]|nr:thioredoxin family protein [Fimbriimonadaceae bacterium]
MRHPLLCFVLVLSLFAVALTQPKPTREPFDPKRDAAKDIAAAIKTAKKENKRIILDVGGEWCIWCKRLDQFFLDNRDCADVLKKNFVVVKVNYSKENENKEVLSKYPKITGYPHLFVLDKNGKLLHSQDTGLLEEGDHHDRTKIMEFLKKWSPTGK